MLIGIVVKNGIVLIDYITLCRERGMSVIHSVVVSGRSRLRPVSLEPMNPFERRIIHSALQNDRYVTTHSEGDEPYRHVVVTLKK